MMLPDSVHHHAGGERIGRIGHRLREFQTPGTFRERGCGLFRQNGHEAGRCRITGIIPVSTQPDLLRGKLLLIGNNLQIRILGGHGLLQPLPLGAQKFQLFLPRPGQKAVDLSIAKAQQAAITEQVVPKRKAVPVHRDQTRLAQVVPARIQPQRDVIPVVDDLLLVINRQHQCLQLRCSLLLCSRIFGLKPRLQKRVIFLRGRKIFVPLLPDFVIEQFIGTIQHVICGPGRKDLSQTYRLPFHILGQLFLFLV